MSKEQQINPPDLSILEQIVQLPNRLSDEEVEQLRTAGLFPDGLATDLLINHLPVVIYINDNKGRCLFISNHIKEVFGYTPEEIFATPGLFARAIHPEDRYKTNTTALTMTGDDPLDEFDHDFRLYTRSGEIRWMRDKGRVLRNDRGEVAFQHGVMYDITAEKVVLAREQQAQKLELAGRIAGGIAHDFNSVLTSVVGLSSIVLSKMDENDPNRAEIEVLHDSAKRAVDLSKRLLSFAGKQTRYVEDLNLNEVIEEAAQIVRPLLGNGKLTLKLCPDLHLIRADRSQMLQVMLNLLMNARDAISDDGSIGVFSANDSEKRLVRICVQDDGPGIDPEHLPHIFEPFFTTKSDGKGTGLGLSTVHGLIEQVKGKIDVDSVAGETTFTVEIPCLSEKVPPEPPAAPSAPDGAGQTVLLVEDELGVRMVVSSLLTKHGFAVIEAEDGCDALAKLDTFDGMISFVLTDVVMPKMGGIALADEIERRQPGTPVVFMSGHADDPMLEEHFASGALFIEKPFTVERLMHILASTPLYNSRSAD